MFYDQDDFSKAKPILSRLVNYRQSLIGALFSTLFSSCSRSREEPPQSEREVPQRVEIKETGGDDLKTFLLGDREPELGTEEDDTDDLHL